FIHYADQFRHGTWSDSVMSQMDQAVVAGHVAPGTQQAWVDAMSAKLRTVFPGINPSQWAISKIQN
ncbi:MAG: hypothetical protein ACREJM_03430, partial [Candidatus Saccharimonadales bacterium]